MIDCRVELVQARIMATSDIKHMMMADKIIRGRDDVLSVEEAAVLAREVVWSPEAV